MVPKHNDCDDDDDDDDGGDDDDDDDDDDVDENDVPCISCTCSFSCGTSS